MSAGVFAGGSMLDAQPSQAEGSNAPNTESDIAPAGDSTSPSADLAPDSGSDTSSDVPADLIDLDKIEKFRLHGEEWTKDKLGSAMLRQADYTRKTQEFSKERKFYDNLAYDIHNVLQNPALVEQFKKIYPEKFHQYLEPYSRYFPQTKPTPANGSQQPQLDPQLMTRINQIESRFHEQEVKAADQMIDGLFKKYSAQYPFADESSVISRALAMMENKKASGEKEDLTQKEWDSVFKSENERVHKLAEAKYKETVDKQLKANRKGKDGAAGGSLPGQSPVRMTMKEATEAAIKHFTNR